MACEIFKVEYLVQGAPIADIATWVENQELCTVEDHYAPCTLPGYDGWVKVQFAPYWGMEDAGRFAQFCAAFHARFV